MRGLFERNSSMSPLYLAFQLFFLFTAATSFFTGVDTVLINVSGRLLTLNPHKPTKEVESDEPFQVLLVIHYFVKGTAFFKQWI